MTPDRLRGYHRPVPLEFRLMVGFDVYRSYAALADSAHAAEDAGFGAIFRGDHLLSVDDQHHVSVTEAWTSLAGLARETTRLRLGTLVSPVTFRHPAVLARMVATVHEMSDGRAEVGLGAGWYEPEHERFGLPLPPWPERFDHLEEQLAVTRGLLAGELVDFEGRHYRLAGATLGEQVAGHPPPRMLVGGNGRPRTMALAARFADEMNLDQIADPAECAQAFAILADRLREIGRPVDLVVHSNVVPWPAGDPGAARAGFEAFEAAGVQRLYVRRPASVPLSELAAFSREFLVGR